jgi:hypothetical protein
MTISSGEIIRERYIGGGAQTNWPVGFPFLQGEDLGVVVTEPSGAENRLTCGLDYTVTVSAEHAGGTVHAAVPDDWGLTIFPDQPFTQETDFRNNGILDAEVLEHCLDKLTLMCLQLKERQRRSIQLADGDAGTPEELREILLDARATAVGAAADATQEAAVAAAHRAVVEERAEAAEQAAEQAGASAATSREWAERAAENASGTGLASPSGHGLVPSGGTAGQVYRTNVAGTAYGWENFPEVRFASAAETVTGTEAGKATTPAGVKAAIDVAVGAIPAGFPSGGIVMWSGAAATVPSGWALCDGTKGTPNLVERFILGAGGAIAAGVTGGAKKTGATTLTLSQMPSHGHGYTAPGYSSQYGGGTTGGGYNGAAGSTTGAVGGSQPHEHDLTPPYYTLCFIMKL